MSVDMAKFPLSFSAWAEQCSYFCNPAIAFSKIYCECKRDKKKIIVIPIPNKGINHRRCSDLCCAYLELPCIWLS